jgi:hypothetical protein
VTERLTESGSNNCNWDLFSVLLHQVFSQLFRERIRGGMASDQPGKYKKPLDRVTTLCHKFGFKIVIVTL